jgi:hypothetical protein
VAQDSGLIRGRRVSVIVGDRLRIAPKLLLPGRGGERVKNDTLCQNQLLPWREWIKA